MEQQMEKVEVEVEASARVQRLNLNKVKKTMKPLEKKGLIFAALMLLIPFINFLIFWVGVNANSIALAFTSVDEVTQKEVFSFYQFEKLFNDLSSPYNQAGRALINTLKYFALHIIKLFLSVGIAYFFYKKVPGHTIYKILFFLPAMIPPMVYINVFKQLISKYGPVYTMVDEFFGYRMPNLFAKSSTATPTILFYVLWSGFGASLLIFVGAMNRIPGEVIDAANLDGCGMAREFVQIVMPLIWETFSTYLLLAIAGLFTESGPFLYFVGADPNSEIYTLSYWIFAQVHGGQYNYPAAIGLFFTFLGLPLVFISRWLMNKVETVTY